MEPGPHCDALIVSLDPARMLCSCLLERTGEFELMVLMTHGMLFNQGDNRLSLIQLFSQTKDKFNGL